MKILQPTQMFVADNGGIACLVNDTGNSAAAEEFWNSSAIWAGVPGKLERYRLVRITRIIGRSTTTFHTEGGNYLQWDGSKANWSGEQELRPVDPADHRLEVADNETAKLVVRR